MDRCGLSVWYKPTTQYPRKRYFFKADAPWHPFFGKTFDIHIHFSRAHTEAYRCRLSSQPGTKRQDIPVRPKNLVHLAITGVMGTYAGK